MEKRFEAMEKRFEAMETEAKNSARTAAEQAEEAERLVGQIKENRDKSVEHLNLQTESLKIVADTSEKADLVVADIREYFGSPPIVKAISEKAISLQQQGKRDEAIEKWRAVAHIAEENDNDIAARAWSSVGYLLENPEDCISVYDRAISLKSDFAEAYYNRGNAKAGTGSLR